MSEKDEFLGCQVGTLERCLQSVSTFTASKSAGKLYFSLISGVKMPQICSICEKKCLLHGGKWGEKYNFRSAIGLFWRNFHGIDIL